MNRPINSFRQFFTDVKPYHTKVLETTETYSFFDPIDIEILEKFDLEYTFENDPLCRAVGFGVNFDSDCGFDTNSCCDIFDCFGGYGLIFDNSDLLLDLPIASLDSDFATITVAGDRRYDTHIQIDQISPTGEVLLLGNYTTILEPHSLFFIKATKTLPVQEVTNSGFYVNGDFTVLLAQKGEFRIINSDQNDELYTVKSVEFDPVTNRTYVQTIFDNLSQTSLGTLLLESNSKNNGFYLITGLSYNGIHTKLTISNETPIKLPSELDHGSAIFRTGLIPPRAIWIEDTQNSNGEWQIIDTVYDFSSGETTITLDGTLLPGDTSFGRVRLYGYRSGAGFDGLEECQTPRADTISAQISEYLLIEITDTSTGLA